MSAAAGRGTLQGQADSKTTLFRHFKTELASGRALLKARVAGKFYNALDKDQPWAIQMAMRNQFGWDAGRGGFDGVPPHLVEGGEVKPLQQIEFIVPGEAARGGASGRTSAWALSLAEGVTSTRAYGAGRLRGVASNGADGMRGPVAKVLKGTFEVPIFKGFPALRLPSPNIITYEWGTSLNVVPASLMVSAAY